MPNNSHLHLLSLPLASGSCHSPELLGLSETLCADETILCLCVLGSCHTIKCPPLWEVAPCFILSHHPPCIATIHHHIYIFLLFRASVTICIWVKVQFLLFCYSCIWFCYHENSGLVEGMGICLLYQCLKSCVVLVPILQ